jgi:hypothetical protein
MMTNTIQTLVAQQRDAIIVFLRDIVAIPSFDSNIREVAARIKSL